MKPSQWAYLHVPEPNREENDGCVIVELKT